jgi:WD40 repeat protein
VAERVAESRKREADDARGQAEKRRDEPAAVNDNLRQANYVADMNLARVAWDENNVGRTRELLEKHRPRPGETDLRGFEWHYLRRLCQRDLLTVKSHVGGVKSVAFTPDGKRLVTSGPSRPRQKASDPMPGMPGDVKFWDAATGQPLRVLLDGPVDQVVSSALSPDGTRLAAIRSNQTILIWDVATGERVTLEGPVKKLAERVAFSPDSKRLACTYYPDVDPPKQAQCSFWIWDLAKREAVVTIDRLSYWTGVPTFSPGRETPGRLPPEDGARRGVGCEDG